MFRPGKKLIAASGVLTLAALSALSTAARAETYSAQRARVLFAEARQLIQAGKYPQACPKLDASFELAPGLGTEFNLADCLEHVGELARAKELFSDVAAKAGEAGQTERAQVALARVAALSVPPAPPAPEATTSVPEVVVKAPAPAPPAELSPFPVQLREEYARLATSAVKLQELRGVLTRLSREQPNDARTQELARSLAKLQQELDQAWTVASRATALAERQAAWSKRAKPNSTARAAALAPPTLPVASREPVAQRR